MQVTRLVLGPLSTNCWLVSAHEEADVAVIDPGGDPPVLLDALRGRRVGAVILTHAHFDHLGAVSELIQRSGAPLLVHEDDAARVTGDGPTGTGGALFGFTGAVAPAADRTVRDGDRIDVGPLRLEVLHTPGHTEGGMCLFVRDPDGGPPHLFSGDTLFAGSVGRTDFPGGDARQLARSIASKLAGLPLETIVHPGHGPDTTVSREARTNPFWPRT